MQRPGYSKRSSGIHRRGYIVLEMADAKDIPTAEHEKEPGKRPPWWKRLWRRRSQQRTRKRKPWTLREFWGKLVWDWLQLLGTLAIPVVVAVAAAWFSWQQSTTQTQIEEQRAQGEALQAYLDQMSTLLLERDLRSSTEDNATQESIEARTLARAQTLTVLGRVDSSRKSQILQFLDEANLIRSVNGKDPIVTLSRADLRGADLRGAYMNAAHLSDANLRDAFLKYANLRHANLHDAHLSDADLSNAFLSSADLSGASGTGANLNEADLSDANLSGAYLDDADLWGAVLSKANLSDADLFGTDLFGADLSGADLNSSYVGDANLRYANLRGADLRGAQLSNADLSEAFLDGADLSGAILDGANLSDAKGVTEEQLENEARTLEGATMPDGSEHR
jgi:uncharacterized protein YjbI with pentapeptide repeats